MGPAMAKAKGSTDPRDPAFELVFKCEQEEIDRRRGKRGRLRISAKADLVADQSPTGLSLSGGGIRSASVCMGAIQALRTAQRLNSIDYLSTVSGGGYTGACLSAAMSARGGGTYPFGDDIFDSPVIGHIRNYSNYLMPRSRSAIRNCSEAAVILLRGLLANAVCVLAFLLFAVVLTALAFPRPDTLADANFLARLLRAVLHSLGTDPGELAIFPAIHAWPFAVPSFLGAFLALLLIAWAMLRSLPSLDRMTSDTSSLILRVAYILLIALLLIAFLDLQPLLIAWFECPPSWASSNISWNDVKAVLIALGSFAGGVSALASSLGKFLQTSKRSQRFVTMALRGATHVALLIAALVLPVVLWVSYIAVSAWVIPNAKVTAFRFPETHLGVILLGFAVSLGIMLCLRANGYSLHRLYRDRLSKAFLVNPIVGGDGLAAPTLLDDARHLGDLPPLDAIKLSSLADSTGPYPLINAALNVQGSLRANKRGRNADFFTFTPHYVGSHLTDYVRTETMEGEDSRLDLASAMAISGAAASANMGSSTVRSLSPTLSLLNIRLGYYLRNPSFIRDGNLGRNRIRRYVQEKWDRFFLFIEMFNGLTETRSTIYLTDGGHIENLGIYALLKRRCGLIFAIDSEADPELSCESLLKLERYARIDLGVRIILPWEQVARHSRDISNALPGHSAPCDSGPHCAIGRIIYPDGAQGLLVYVKSSLSGDEKDYILDYAERNPDFPHETTGDQFFSEEQFEMYRALGYHMVDGLFGDDTISFATGKYGFATQDEARKALNEAFPVTPNDPPVRKQIRKRRPDGAETGESLS